MVIRTHAKFHFNWLMLTLIFGHKNSCQVSFQLVDVNLDFWYLGLSAPPPPPGLGMADNALSILFSSKVIMAGDCRNQRDK